MSASSAGSGRVARGRCQRFSHAANGRRRLGCTHPNRLRPPPLATQPLGYERLKRWRERTQASAEELVAEVGCKMAQVLALRNENAVLKVSTMCLHSVFMDSMHIFIVAYIQGWGARQRSETKTPREVRGSAAWAVV